MPRKGGANGCHPSHHIPVFRGLPHRLAVDDFGISGDPTLAGIGSVADRYPVFRVVPH
jgi:hypothetical protein